MDAGEDEVRVVLQRTAFGEGEREAAKARFVTHVGYVDKEHAVAAAARIEGHQR
jgi:hypothetical protein